MSIQSTKPASLYGFRNRWPFHGRGELKNAVEELQEKVQAIQEPTSGFPTYEWVTERITTKFEELESRIDQLQAQLDTLVVTKRIVELEKE